MFDAAINHVTERTERIDRAQEAVIRHRDARAAAWSAEVITCEIYEQDHERPTWREDSVADARDLIRCATELPPASWTWLR
jgi:hypothetical protein